jgi:hypothetical protein
MTIFDNGRVLAIRQLSPSAQGGKGQTATLTYQPPGGTYVDGAVVPLSPVVQTISGLETSIKVDRVNGSTILAGDAEFKMSPVTTAGADVQLPDALPLQATLTLADGTVKQVVGVDPKRPSGLLISATLQLRGTG